MGQQDSRTAALLGPTPSGMCRLLHNSLSAEAAGCSEPPNLSMYSAKRQRLQCRRNNNKYTVQKVNM